ncbi:hypothetical protein SAMN05720781_0430 [Fibrobacter sp. UWT3]|jgi:hypothetical protein|uniref:hypothetical protein n=1 Tax=Fibrobacter sp. UWT3 TaxID=1896225 RepID=UPI000BDD16AE|nr:hypothetical protein [Fibrobacter sp. UWT3]SOE51177.1 hypothetical protein SAMN05720781_0430 [Fibrobacter sp. UWT3]
MTLNTIEKTREAIRAQDRSKKAAILRLQKAGIITKQCKLAPIYRTPTPAK